MESSSWCYRYRRAGKVTHFTAIQAQFQGIELANPNIYPIDELLKHMKGPVLPIKSFRISTTQGNNRISERSLGEDPELIAKQKPEV